MQLRVNEHFSQKHFQESQYYFFTVRTEVLYLQRTRVDPNAGEARAPGEAHHQREHGGVLRPVLDEAARDAGPPLH